jgi:iron(III) transport system substrate-binding protein
VVAGEKACGLVVDFMTVRSKRDGAPVEFVYPLEGSPAVTEPIGILKTTEVPELAKAFVDFVLSAKGQKVAAEMGYTPVKDGVEAPEGLKSVREIKSMVYDIAVLKEAREAEKARFSAMFQ